MEPIFCPSCKYQLLPTFYFCPNCGKKLHEPPLNTGIVKQITIYLISVLFPPFGLFPGVTYVMDKNGKAKTIGTIAIILTIASTVITTWFVYVTVKDINKALNNQLQMQISLPQNSGL